MAKVIEFGLDTSEISRAIKQLDDYKKWVEDKTDEVTKTLAYVGLMGATIRFENAYYPHGTNDVTVRIDEQNDHRYNVIAEGQSVAFIEFGAGVYTEPQTTMFQSDGGLFINYPGSWSEDHARTYQAWERSHLPLEEYPFNVQPTMAMQIAAEEVRQMVEGIVREVFSQP